ncbi:MAG: DUF6702 family protein, partial [Bacteroidota bacterium]
VSATETELLLDVEVDRGGYAQVNGAEQMIPDAETFEEYLNQKSSWVVNGVHYPVSVEKITTEGHHFTAHCKLSSEAADVQQVKVYNWFLLEVPDQTNVVMLKLHEKNRGFRMHAGRKVVEAKY